jgi:hypothetical protein
MCAELSAQAQIGAVQRRLEELLRRATVLIGVDIDVYRATPVVPPGRRLTEHLAVHTCRRRDAD